MYVVFEKEHASLHISSILKQPRYPTQTQRWDLKFSVEIQWCFTVEGVHFQGGLLVSILHTAGFSRGEY